jgi:hypothetical protein
MQLYVGRIVFFKGWKAFTKRSKMVIGDTNGGFKGGFKIQMHRFDTFVEVVWDRNKHAR